MSEQNKGVVRVGVKRWNDDQPAQPGEPANGEIGPLWVEIDGVRIPGDILRQASHRFEVTEGDVGFGITTFEVITSSYETVDEAS